MEWYWKAILVGLEISGKCPPTFVIFPKTQWQKKPVRWIFVSTNMLKLNPLAYTVYSPVYSMLAHIAILGSLKFFKSKQSMWHLLYVRLQGAVQRPSLHVFRHEALSSQHQQSQPLLQRAKLRVGRLCLIYKRNGVTERSITIAVILWCVCIRNPWM